MKRKVIALLCILAMTIGLFAGCKGNKAAKTTNEGKATSAPEKTTQEDKKETAATTAPAAATSKYTQASVLAEQEKAGTIPAIEKRLPADEDIMVETMDSIGTYGEAFSFTFNGKESQWFYGKITEEPLFRFKNDGTVEPNVAKGFEVNSDCTVYTIHLRKGMKWSDGVDFTAEDCIFFYNEMCVKESFGKKLWDCFKIADPQGNETTAEFKKVDDYTFTVTFKYPKPTFLEEVAINGKWCFAPAHWYKEVLPAFIGEDKAAAKATEMGYSDVAAMGKETGYYYWNVPGRPTLRPWVVFKDAENNKCDGDYFVMKRNPYYWKVDEKGQQLPYVDELRFTRISDPSQALLKILDGSTDIGTANYADYDTLVENKDAGGYEMLEWTDSSWAAMTSQLHLNMTVKDDNKRALFNNADFRQALSVAVNREEYAEILSNGFASGKQASPNKGALGYSEEWSKKWTEYNPDKAKTLLEACGLVKGSDGYYDFKDGTDFVLNIQTFTESNADQSAELILQYFDKAGIKCTYKPVDRAVLDNMTTSNDHEAILGPVVPAETISIVLRPDTIVPVRNYAAWYGSIGNWYNSKGAEGMAPTGDLLELCNLNDKLRAAMTIKEKEEIALQMYKLHEKNIWVIGYMGNTPVLVIKDKNIKNFPDSAIFCDEFREFGLAHLQCCYFAK